MMKIEFDKKDYQSFKDMYHDISVKLDKDRFIDWRDDYVDLGLSADILQEFLWYCHRDNNHYIFKNFELEKIRNHKTYENYEYSLIIKVFERFVKQYPKNTLEFVNDEEDNNSN